MQDDIMEKRFNTQLQKKFAMIDKTTLQLKERMESTIERKTELDMKPRAPIIPRIDPMTLPYRPKLIIPKEKIEELFSMINLMDSQQLKQYSIVNNITLNVEDPISGDSLIHKVITSPNLLKKEFHRLNIVKFLVQNNVHPDKPNKENQTPLHLACKAQYSTIVNYLISLDVDLNFQDNYGFSSLHYALQGKIELYDAPKEVKDFIGKPKNIDFDKKKNLIEIKKELWEIIKDDPFLGLLKNTLDISIFSDSKIKKLVLDYKKKLVDTAINPKVIDKNKVIKEDYESIKKGISELVEQQWNKFQDIEELEFHEKKDNSWIVDDDQDYSPLKIKDVKSEIKKKSRDAKEKIKELCKSIPEEIYKPNEEYENELNKFYNEFFNENTESFNSVVRGGITYYTLNTDITQTTWESFNEKKMSSLAVDYADNIINWQELSFIGGSREIAILSDDRINIVLQDINIQEKVLYILLDHLIKDTDNIEYFDNIIDTTKNDNPIFNYGAGTINDWIEYDKIILAYNMIFSNKEPVPFPDALSAIAMGAMEPWTANPVRKGYIDKWTNLFKTKNKASVLYTMYSAYSLTRSGPSNIGKLYNTISGLTSALALTEEGTIITDEILLNGIKKFFISYVLNNMPAPLNQKDVIIKIINILLSTQTINLNQDLPIINKVDELFTLTDEIEIQNKTNEIIKDLLKEIKQMKYKPEDSDVLGLITFLNNGFKLEDIDYFKLDKVYIDPPPIAGMEPNIPPPIFNLSPDEDYNINSLLNIKLKLNKILHIIKKRQTTTLIPYINHIFETLEPAFNPRLTNQFTFNDFSHRKLHEAKCLGLYYLGLIPNFNEFNNDYFDIVKSNTEAFILTPKTGAQYYTFTNGNLDPNLIPLPGNFVDGNLSLLDKLNYNEFSSNPANDTVYRQRPPLRFARDILEERNKTYLINILHHVLNSTENSLINLIDDNRNLSKSFRDIYPIITIIADILESYGENRIKETVKEIIDNLNSYNSYIFLYYYIYHQDNLMKLPKFNYYEIPQLDETGKFLYYDDQGNRLYDDDTNQLVSPKKITNVIETIIPENIQATVIYNKGLSRFTRLLQNISNNFMKGNYFIEKKSLILAKDSKLPPALKSKLSELYRYNLIKLVLIVFEKIKDDNNQNIITKIRDLDLTQKYFYIGKIVQELVKDLTKKYIQEQTKMIMTKIINNDENIFTRIFTMIKETLEELFIIPKDYGINLDETNIEIINLNILKKHRICSGFEDINEFIIYPEEYANSELLKSKYVLKTHNQIYKKLLENDSRFLLDSNNQTAIFPILKFHEDEILNRLKDLTEIKDFSDINSYDFLVDEFNNHLFKLTNGNNIYKEWLCNFVLYQKEEVVNLILSNDKYGNNFPNYLDNSFEVVCYIVNKYLSEPNSNVLETFKNINKIEEVNLITYNMNTREKFIIDEKKNIEEDIINFYNETNKISEIYFKSSKYTEYNYVLEIVKELLISMTKQFIILPYISFVKKILYEFFKNTFPFSSKEQLNIRVDNNFDENIKNILLNEISVKIVENATNIFENSYKESEFNLESTKELLDSITDLLTVKPDLLIEKDSTGYKNLKEVNSYFDTFVNKTVLNWNVICENVLKFNINQGRIIKCINSLRS